MPLKPLDSRSRDDKVKYCHINTMNKLLNLLCSVICLASFRDTAIVKFWCTGLSQAEVTRLTEQTDILLLPIAAIWTRQQLLAVAKIFHFYTLASRLRCMHKNLPNLNLFTSGWILTAESDNIYGLVMDTFCLAVIFFCCCC